MFLLFINACFTYLIAKFASYCQHQGPCVLCSRYDHVLAKDKTGIYWDSFFNHLIIISLRFHLWLLFPMLMEYVKIV
ncbi:putative myosin-binding protein [Helianthus annuus]|nr:putative myosin-binding protein [Helianthus annuus]